VALVAVAVAAVAVAGAVAVRLASGGSAAADAASLKLRVTAEQWRQHEVARQVAIALYNDGPVPVRVSRLELVAPSFDGLAAVAVDALLPPGGLRVDVPISYGIGRCDGVNTTPSAEPSTVLVEATPAGGRARTLTLRLAQPNPMLDKLLRNDCEQARLRRAVATVHFGGWRADAAGLRGTVVVERGAEDTPVTLQDLTGSIMYSLDPDPAGRPRPLGTLAAGQRRLVVPVTARPGRCDQHALAEIKKPFVFPAWITLGDGERRYTEIAVSDPDRKLLDRMLRRVCHLPPAGS
jgi:hypothetical protein